MELPPPDEQHCAEFQTLYKARFGVESKPEYAMLMTELHLSPKEGVQFIEDLISLIQQVFDDYFEELKTGSTPRHP